MLTSKKILLFAPKYFGYEKDIVAKLSEMGANVDYYDERPGNGFFIKSVIRLSRNTFNFFIKMYYSKILKETAKQKYDYVFVVNLEALSPSILSKIKLQQPNAKFILYMWDSIQNKKNAISTLPYFDCTLTFDSDDAKKINNLHLRPLFFSDIYDAHTWGDLNNKEDIDFLFIGTMHSDRYSILQIIKDFVLSHEMSIYLYMYFQFNILFWYKIIRDKKFRVASKREFNFTELKRSQVIDYLKRAKIIIDIEHPEQAGLTSRTLEMLGAKKKIITTNIHIKEYDFYDEQNVLIIDRDSPQIPLGFLNSNYKDVSEDIRFKYSIRGWLTEIFKTADDSLTGYTQKTD